MVKSQKIDIFATTIWDESIYKAWTQMLEQIIPDIRKFNKVMEQFAGIFGCDEVILVEKLTFLKIGNFSKEKEDKKIKKVERLASLIKNIKISSAKKGRSLKSIQLKTEEYNVFIEQFSTNTFIILIFYERVPNDNLVKLNIKLASRTLQAQVGDNKLQFMW